jgi:hypothetical protein
LVLKKKRERERELGSELMVEKGGNRNLWSENIIEAKAYKGL